MNGTPLLGFLRLFLTLTRHNLDPLRINLVLIIKLELDIFDEKGPDFVTESVGV